MFVQRNQVRVWDSQRSLWERCVWERCVLFFLILSVTASPSSRSERCWIRRVQSTSSDYPSDYSNRRNSWLQRTWQHRCEGIVWLFMFPQNWRVSCFISGASLIFWSHGRNLWLLSKISWIHPYRRAYNTNDPGLFRIHDRNYTHDCKQSWLWDLFRFIR